MRRRKRRLPPDSLALPQVVGHGYMNDTPEPYASWEARTAAMGMPPFDQATVDKSWDKLIAFFKKHLAA